MPSAPLNTGTAAQIPKSSKSKRRRSHDIPIPAVLPDGKVSADLSKDILQFAVVGFAKCGTTFLLKNVFGASRYLNMGRNREIHDLEHRTVKKFLRHYRGQVNATTEDGYPILNGYKSPSALESEQSLWYLEQYFPATKFIVGVRHPISRFQSWYNFKLARMAENIPMPPIEHTIGQCHELCDAFPNKTCVSKNTTYYPIRGCSEDANYQYFFSRLGWTPRTSERELSLLNHHTLTIHNFSQAKLFVVEAEQIKETNPERANRVFGDLETYLELPALSLPRVDSTKDKSSSARYKAAYHEREGMTKAKQAQLLDICQPQHGKLRQYLLEIGTNAADWIEEFFLPSPHVVVSNHTEFVEAIRKWKIDPCASKS